MSGETWRPKKVSSSAVLTMTVSRRGSRSELRPRRKRAAPTPPASTVTRSVRRLIAAPAIKCRPLYRNSSHPLNQRAYGFRREILPCIRSRRLRDLLLHQRAAEVVAPRPERELGELRAQLDPRGLQV